MADEKKNGKNGEQTEKNMSDYEELLDGFATGDESDEAQDGIALSELLDGIESQDESGESGGDLGKELDDVDFDALDELNIEDFTDQPSEDDPDKTVEKTNSGVFDIDIDEDDDDDLGGYSSLLSELESEKYEETEKQGEDAGAEKTVTREIPVLEDIESSEDTGEEEGIIPENESEELLGEEAGTNGNLFDEELNEEPEKSSKPPTQETPVFEYEEPSKEIDVPFSDEEDKAVETEFEKPVQNDIGKDIEDTSDSTGLSYFDEPVLDEIDYDPENAPEEDKEHEVVSDMTSESDMEEIDFGESIADTDKNVSYASMLDDTADSEDQAGEYDGITERKSIDEDEFSLDEFASDEDDTGELSLGEELQPELDSGDESSFDDFLSPADSDNEEFVISGAGDSDDEEDFLHIHEEESETVSGEDDLIPGVADVSSALAAEVNIDGFEMNIEEQIRAVTRAELLLAQGKTSEAADVFSQIVENRGVTPWVAKRCAELGVDISENTVSSESKETVG